MTVCPAFYLLLLTFGFGSVTFVNEMVCMLKKLAHITLLSAGLFLLSCKDRPSKNHGPIVLGDSSTIVTERDPQKLQDLVTDLNPVIPAAESKDTAESKPVAAAPDTTKKVKATTPTPPPSPAAFQQQLSASMGMLAEFKDVSVLITNVSGKLSGNTNLQRASGAVYTLASGNINGATMRLKGNVTKVSQRYQSTVVLRNNYGTFILEDFSTTTDWEALKGGGNQYRITGLDAQSLEVPEANANSIRNAVTKACKRRRISRKKMDEVVSSVRHVRKADQKPLLIVLRSVMWKIDGKDAQGKLFSKQVRVDIPL